MKLNRLNAKMKHLKMKCINLFSSVRDWATKKKAKPPSKALINDRVSIQVEEKSTSMSPQTLGLDTPSNNLSLETFSPMSRSVSEFGYDEDPRKSDFSVSPPKIVPNPIVHEPIKESMNESDDTTVKNLTPISIVADHNQEGQELKTGTEMKSVQETLSDSVNSQESCPAGKVDICNREDSDGISIGCFSRSVSPEHVDVDCRIPMRDNCQNLKNRTVIKKIKKRTKTVIPVPPLTSCTPECRDKYAPTQKKQPLTNVHRRLIKQKSHHQRKPNKVKSSWLMFLTFALIFQTKSASVFIAVIVFWLLVGKVGCIDPERERMHHESCRLESFLNYQGRGNHLVLVQNGFYCNETESPTTTRCYACDLVVSDWQDCSDVPGHHRTHSPHCIVHSNPISPVVDQTEHRPAIQGIERVEHIAEREAALQGAEGGEDISARAHDSPSFASLLQYFQTRHSTQLYPETELFLPEPADLYDRPLSFTDLGVRLRESNVTAAGVNPYNQQPTVNCHFNGDLEGNT